MFATGSGSTSKRAGVCFLGFEPPEEGKEHDFVRGMNSVMPHERNTTVVIVWSAGEMQLDA